jgi:hypothetical protein
MARKKKSKGIVIREGLLASLARMSKNSESIPTNLELDVDSLIPSNKEIEEQILKHWESGNTYPKPRSHIR